MSASGRTWHGASYPITPANRMAKYRGPKYSKRSEKRPSSHTPERRRIQGRQAEAITTSYRGATFARSGRSARSRPEMPSYERLPSLRRGLRYHRACFRGPQRCSDPATPACAAGAQFGCQLRGAGKFRGAKTSLRTSALSRDCSPSRDADPSSRRGPERSRGRRVLPSVRRQPGRGRFPEVFCGHRPILR